MKRLGWIALALMSVATALAVGQVWHLRSTPVPVPAAPAFGALPVFPNNLQPLVGLINRVQSHLSIVADFCAYGSYSNPAGFVEYRAALEAKAAEPNRTVSLTTYNSSRVGEMSLEQFDLASGSDAVRQGALNDLRSQPKFRAWLALRQKEQPSFVEPTTIPEFVKANQDEEAQCIQRFRTKNITVRPVIDRELAVFSWVRDDEEAFISIYSFGPNVQEAPFFTTAKPFIRLLNGIADQHARRAQRQ
jgi:hypothetical protein